MAIRELVPVSDIERQIFLIRGHKVMIDRDLARLYQVPTKVMNQTIKRNQDRFPDGFMFRLSPQETRELVTNCDRFTKLKHSSATPFAFTEYGVAMLSSVLRSKRAIRINIQIIQTFIRLRQWALTHKDLAQKIAELENKSRTHDKHIQNIFEAIRELINPPEQPRKSIGFRPGS
ncbi:MAG: ORF6N domain-containing protein [Rectinemataceae bacterium]|nr:ORF6N domain-containing protein [Rectinemataceae bacterium]